MYSTGKGQQVWNIGVADSSAVELALGPDRYKEFLANDFGFEDRYYLVGRSDAKESFPYVCRGLPTNGEEPGLLPVCGRMSLIFSLAWINFRQRENGIW